MTFSAQIRHGRRCTLPLLLVVTLSASFGCSEAPESCFDRCLGAKAHILVVSQSVDETPLKDGEVCTRDAIVDADDACACKAAFRDEFQMQFADLMCDCREDDAFFVMRRENCSGESVPLNDENCAELESAAYQQRLDTCEAGG